MVATAVTAGVWVCHSAGAGAAHIGAGTTAGVGAILTEDGIAHTTEILIGDGVQVTMVVDITVVVTTAPCIEEVVLTDMALPTETLIS